MRRPTGLTRRGLLAAPAAMAAFGRAHGMQPPPAAPAPAAAIERDRDGVIETVLHGGAGLLKVKWFSFGPAPAPNLFISYVIPPGCSEGEHVHRLGDTALGAYDEYYYIVSGAGVMTLDGREIAVAAGDHVHAPLGVAHGIANPHGREDLKLLLTAVERR